MASEEIAKELAGAKLEAAEDVVTPWVSKISSSKEKSSEICNIYIDFYDPESFKNCINSRLLKAPTTVASIMTNSSQNLAVLRLTTS